MSVAPALDAVAKDVGKFNGFMAARSFVSGIALSQDDVAYFGAFPEVPGDKFVHAQRWQDLCPPPPPHVRGSRAHGANGCPSGTIARAVAALLPRERLGLSSR